MNRKIKKLISTILILSFVLVIVSGCGGDTGNDNGNGDNDKSEYSFAFVVTNQLGDKSFNDSAALGCKKIEEELGFPAKVIEIGRDQTQFEPTLLDLSDSGEYTAIFLNGSDYKEIVEDIAEDYPDQKYVLFDTSIEEGEFDNVYGITYKQNEASYLAGVLAALVTSSDMEYANDEEKIGFIGGDENPIINDFLVGYIEGAKSILPDVKVYVSYVGSWTDTAKAKEIALAQFDEGVDITFPCAMTAGNGAIEAAVSNNKYIIGVDSDQAMLYADSGDEESANIILTSVLKEVGQSLYLYAEDVKNGNDKYGITDSLGIEEGAVGLAQSKYYEDNVPEEIRKQIDEVEQKIIDGEIEVSTALGEDTEKIESIIKSVAP